MKVKDSHLIACGINECNARRAIRPSAVANVLTALVLGVSIGLALVWGLS